MEDLSTITGRIIPSLLVTQLKALIKTLNETIRPAPQLKLSGNKSDLINRVVGFITQYHQLGDQAVIRQIRHCVAAFNQGDVSITTPSVALHHPHSSNNIGSSSTNVYRLSSGSTSSSSSMLGSKTGAGYPPIQSQNGNMNMQRSQHQTHHSATQHHIQHRQSHPPAQIFKSSPFYRDIQTLTPPRLCIEAKDRTLSVTLSFTVAPMLSIQLKKDPEYQLMVFSGWADGPSSPVLMEFPHVCEIKVNGRVLEANLRGMKNKPGTVSPANITKLCRLEAADYNKVEFIYANSTKRYYVSTHLVKKTSVESIVAEIERGKFLSKEKMLRMIEDRNKDDDIMATSSTLSLKCPLGFQRIKIPCRSSYCQHLQCFDAYTFFNLNEQTPTWTCPVCSRVMHSWEEIVVDGYFKNILNSTPKDLENITVQADGSWEIPSAPSQTEQAAAPSPKKKTPTGDSVFIIDEDDSDDNEDSASAAPPAKPSKPATEVIDLISDSEEDEPTAIDTEGDSIMKDAANSLQNMAAAAHVMVPGEPPSVKTEIFDKPTPTETGVTPAPLELHSILSSTNASRAASSESSPIISTRMAQTEPLQSGPITPPVSRVGPVWESGEDVFMNALLNPRRKRQFDDTGDSESPNSMAYEARQRIARLDIHSNASSERGSSSTIPSPDAPRRSTSSPTPIPAFHDLDRRGAGEHQTEIDDGILRSRREHTLSRPVSMAYYDGGNQSSSGPPISSAQSVFAPPHLSPHHQGSRSARSSTMSPPLQHPYNNSSPHQHHHSAHRSTNSPGPDYYPGISRPPSSGSMATSTNIGSRSNAAIAPSFGGSTAAWPSDLFINGSQDRANRGWAADQLPSIYGGNVHLNHESNSPRRVSADETRANSSSRHSSPAQTASSTKYPHLYNSHPYSSPSNTQQTQQSSHHQRHRSNDEMAGYGRREDGVDSGKYQHRSSYSIDEGQDNRRSGYGAGHHVQNVYNSNQASQASVSNDISQLNGGSQGIGTPSALAATNDHRWSDNIVTHVNTGVSKDDEGPIFLHGLRGARAR
ncbi:PINIT domain-domain-containing protein [Lobosporangium transversale]|uniref:PINIT domain-domain-containing protein n=1 Tax=Lobosporangium transversale TaxID=64571 RepID=A0A1Y2GFL0_9FUNG|nr:PINIT domain-domain-containing protein [Lobosporangium transversale]ORZ09408.1 PINIT domain-domain-containing protein [Lobosporangium transversale]|eukprot:XP_021878861.1 PINIT domain-domain-containing protein [Lobosporangium transversale]